MNVDAPARSQSRLAMRLLAEMRLTSLVRAIDVVRRITGGSFVFDRGILFLAILRASSGTLGNWPTPSTQPVDEGGISINALSHSMRRPFETVRRHVNALIASGLCDRTAHGVVAAPALRDNADVAALLIHLHDSLVWLTGEFRAFDVPLPRTAAGTPYRADMTLAAAIDLALAAFENVGVIFEDWLELAVVSSIVLASARPITSDPDLARLYSEADTVPPPERRRVITAAMVSRGLHIPYSTVRRQMLASIASGMLERRDDGVVVTQMLLGDAAAAAGVTALSRTSASLGRLVAAGFPFDDPARAYIAGPPTLVAFD